MVKIGFEIIINIRPLRTITVMKDIICCQIVLFCNIYTFILIKLMVYKYAIAHFSILLKFAF